METTEFNIWVIIAPIITSAISVIGACLVAWLTARANTKNAIEDRKTTEAREQKRLETKREEHRANDLDKIIYPAIYSLEIQKIIADSKARHCRWFQYLLTEGIDETEQELIIILNSLKAQVNPSIVIELIQQTLLEKYDLVPFFKRYNKGTFRAVDIDVKKLNEDIVFINAILGKHYELFEEA